MRGHWKARRPVRIGAQPGLDLVAVRPIPERRKRVNAIGGRADLDRPAACYWIELLAFRQRSADRVQRAAYSPDRKVEPAQLPDASDLLWFERVHEWRGEQHLDLLLCE